MPNLVPVYQNGNRAHALVTPGFGGRLMRARIRAGFASQPQLAREAGLSVNTVCRHEIERVAPSLAAITTYARVLNVSAAYLQYGLGDPTIPPAVGHYLRTHRGLLLLVETRARLLAIPWSLLCGDEVTQEQVHAIAHVVDVNLRTRGDFVDREQRLPQRHQAFPDGSGQGYLPLDRREAAGA